MPPTGGTTPVAPAGYWTPLRKLFALWGAIVLAGFVFTYLNQTATPLLIDGVWAALSLIGLAYMKTLLPLRGSSGAIFFTWLILIVGGIVLTHLSFTNPSLLFIAPQIGIFWLVIMGLGHAITGAIDGKKVYIATAGLQFIAAGGTAMLLSSDPTLFAMQYLIAGIAGALAMGILIVYG